MNEETYIRRKDAIDNLQREIADIYKERSLKSIAGPHSSYIINGREVLPWFFQVVRKGQNKFKEVNFHEAFDDIVFCADEIMHFTAQLYLYMPYLNNPIDDGFKFYDRMIYPNRQNLAAKRFGMYSNLVFEKVYNFWDRIGDLLAVYFPEIFSGKKIYFGTVISMIPKGYHSQSYEWLKDFQLKNYKDMNELRIKVVHYINNDTTFKYQHIELVHNKEGIEKLISDRASLPDYFKSHMELALTGFEKTIELIDEITQARLQDID